MRGSTRQHSCPIPAGVCGVYPQSSGATPTYQNHCILQTRIHPITKLTEGHFHNMHKCIRNRNRYCAIGFRNLRYDCLMRFEAPLVLTDAKITSIPKKGYMYGECEYEHNKRIDPRTDCIYRKFGTLALLVTRK